MPSPERLDPRAPRFNQGVVGGLSLLAFLFDAPIVLPVLAAFLAAGAFLGPAWNPLAQAWTRVVVPGFRLQPPAALKPAAPVRFAQAVGFACLAAASIALLALPVTPLVGWALTLVVAALALLAAVTDVCVGCEAYVLIARFTGSRADGTG